MKAPRRRFLRLIAGALALPTAWQIAEAQTYPSRPLTMIVPVAAGGPMDSVARIMAERMREFLGQPVIVENVTGAGGTIGVGRVARAASDGYTFILGNNSTHVLNGAVYTLQYDLLNDFEPVSLIATNPLLIVAKRGMPANNLRDSLLGCSQIRALRLRGYLASAVSNIFPASSSRRRLAQAFSSCLIVVSHLPWRICSEGKST
jgi:tripartite-type tricarboxylate transporter receptor subunit TctC